MYLIQFSLVIFFVLFVLGNNLTESHTTATVSIETLKTTETTVQHTAYHTSIETAPKALTTHSKEINCTNCMSGCNFTNGQCEGQCLSGYYGRSCNEKCSPKCSDEDGCEIISGRCISCLQPYYGSNCENNCSSSCLYGCDSSGTCFGCKNYKYGSVCNMTCSGNCNLGCDQMNGTCMYGCKLGYSGWNCTTPCPSNCVKSKGCRQGDNSCFQCVSGYGGKKGDCREKCKDSNCKECRNDPSKCSVCKDGWYGEDCSNPCFKHCLNNQCNKISGQCNCALGWFGESCDQRCFDKCDICMDNDTCLTCSEGYYGSLCNMSCPSECSNCSSYGNCETCADKFYGEECKCSVDKCETFNGSTCNKCIDNKWYPVSGGCCPYSRQCMQGYDTNGTCIGGCKAGYWGDTCLHTCSPNCVGGASNCDSSTGNCLHGCTNGWYTARCDYECSRATPNCMNCTEAYDGKAFCSVCDQGYHLVVDECVKCNNCLDDECDSMTGLCTKGCKQGYFDATGKRYRCEHICNIGCVEDECNFETGECSKGCKPGYRGDKCQMHCPPHCKNDHCYPDTGYCIDGCEPGYFKGNCTNTCGHCLNVTCDQVIGTCIGCSVGYYGELCDQVCDYCDNGLCKQYTGECKKENGTCVDKCALCDVENSRCLKCQKGFTGSECEVVCSKRCLNNACKSKANNCTDGCKDEYYGASCTQRCSTRCLLGKCDDKTSKCLVGCISGWLGEHCDVKTSAVRSLDIVTHINTGATVGAAFGSAGLVLFVVFIIYYLKKRKRRRNPGFYTLDQREY